MNQQPSPLRSTIHWAATGALASVLAGLTATAALAQQPQPNSIWPSAAAAVASASPSAIQAHVIVGASARGVASKLKEIYKDQPNLLISDIKGDKERPDQIVVQGPPALQHE